MSATHTIEMDPTPEFVGSTVLVDGENVPGIVAIDIHAEVGDAPNVTFTLRREEGDVTYLDSVSVVRVGGAANRCAGYPSSTGSS